MVRTGGSKSTRLLLAMVVIGVVFGAIVLTPRWWPDGDGLVNVEPQMLVVHDQARGVTDLGAGLSVSLLADGLRVTHEGDVVLQTVPLGSMVSAGMGAVTASGSPAAAASAFTEKVATTLDNMEVTGRRAITAGVRYTGRLFNETRSEPFTMTATRLGQRIDLHVEVPGAQLLVLHTAFEHTTMGVPQRLPRRNLHSNGWWVQAATQRDVAGAVFSTYLGATIGVLSQGLTALDMRQEGRTDVHVWSSAATLTVSWYGRSGVKGELHPIAAGRLGQLVGSPPQAQGDLAQ